MDFVRFKIVDKKIAKRTAQQETYIEPVRTLNALTRIEGKSTGRIVYAFPKIVIPDDKLLEVEIYEKGGGDGNTTEPGTDERWWSETKE